MKLAKKISFVKLQPWKPEYQWRSIN